ncbi:hypothetical protein [Halobacterium noricense]|uniref:hypothetical protein n=1 Tax=Halobacterium noricense TaxID=223182 RepID=UPI001E625790|nr:hypothetical protein [Halobacterium noricense]UHH26986.1 hypothetical protein LT974_17035 [Halobacterium noricense]
MSQNDSKREVACTLTEEQEAERREEVRARLIDHYLGYEEHENGVVVRFDGTDESLEALAAFTSNELQCCSFAEYEIAVSLPYEETVLTVTGPDGTTEMFQDGFVDRLDVESA